MEGFSSGQRKKDVGMLSDGVVALLAGPGSHPHAGVLPKSPGIPTLCSLPQFRLQAAFQPHYTARGCYLYRKGPCCRELCSQHVPPGTAQGQGSSCRQARLPEGSCDAEGACGSPGGFPGCQSHHAPGRQQQLQHDGV